MAAGIVEAVTKWQFASNIPADVAVNTLHFELSDEDDPLLWDIVGARVINFWNSSTAPQVNPLDAYLSAYVNVTTGNQIRVYKLSDPKPRAPVDTYNISRAASPLSTSSLPFEVAVCGSFKSAPISGIPAGRLRNRIYVGPLNQSAMQTTASQPSRPTAVFMADITRAFTRLEAANTADVVWCGYSPTGGIGWAPATCWVDNEFDSQRRRGQDATARTTVTF